MDSIDSKGRFPTTRWSAISALQSGAEERRLALETLVQMYWKPVYKYLRIQYRKSNEDAKDLTQSFFARAIEKDFFANYDSGRSRFRTYIRVCLDGFVANEQKAMGAQKRGGGAMILPLDFHQAEAEMRHSPPSPEDCFEKEWIRNLFSVALEDLRADCEKNGKETHFKLFVEYDVDRDEQISYADLASRYNLPVTSVTNYLASMRKEFRRIVIAKLQEITGSEKEFRDEARRILGVSVG